MPVPAVIEVTKEGAPVTFDQAIELPDKKEGMPVRRAHGTVPAVKAPP
jgi:hypothetical protein